MTELSLYHSCLRKVSFLLRDGLWKTERVNPFCSLPPEVVHDLVSSTLQLQHSNGLRAADLELLLSSGQIREFKIHEMRVRPQELVSILKTLASACHNLEDLTLMGISYCIQNPATAQAMHRLLRNSANLRSIHSSVKFNLKVLKNCKKLRRIMLHFMPLQPWYDFLGEEHGRLQPLDSLELFTICHSPLKSFSTEFASYVVTILRHCPSLASFGCIDTSEALAELHRTGILPQVKLQTCFWGIHSYRTRLTPGYVIFNNSDWIRDSVTFHPFVEELHFYVHSEYSIGYLSGLRNLVFLDIRAEIEGNLNLLFCNVLKDIGDRLKYLSFYFECPIDLSVMLQNCSNLEALRIRATKFTAFSKPTLSLPNLKHLAYEGCNNEDVQRILPLFSNCNSLREIFLVHTSGFDDEVLDKFLSSNSLSNLKVAYFHRCSLTVRGFVKFFLHSPELEKIEIPGLMRAEKQEVDRHVKRALLETNHNALFNKDLVHLADEFFAKKTFCTPDY